MTTLNTPEPKFSKRTKVLTFVALLTLAIIVYAISWFGIPGPNYAEEVAKPIETALIKAGATKMCSKGDAGRGWDNREPWYGAVYVIEKDVPNTKIAIEDTVKSVGYGLSNFSENSKYWEADIIGMKISDFRYRNSNVDAKGGFSINKTSHYSESVDKEFCTQTGGQGLIDGKTTFSFGVRLPSLK